MRTGIRACRAVMRRHAPPHHPPSPRSLAAHLPKPHDVWVPRKHAVVDDFPLYILVYLQAQRRRQVRECRHIWQRSLTTTAGSCPRPAAPPLPPGCHRPSHPPHTALGRTFSPRSMYLTATSSPVSLARHSLATPKLPEPMSRICSACVIGGTRSTRSTWFHQRGRHRHLPPQRRRAAPALAGCARPATTHQLIASAGVHGPRRAPTSRPSVSSGGAPVPVGGPCVCWLDDLRHGGHNRGVGKPQWAVQAPVGGLPARGGCCAARCAWGGADGNPTPRP